MIMIHQSFLISTDTIVRLDSIKYGLSQALCAAHQRQGYHLDPGVQACKLLLLNGLVNTVASQGRKCCRSPVYKGGACHLSKAVAPSQEVVTALGGSMLLNKLIQVLQFATADISIAHTNSAFLV